MAHSVALLGLHPNLLDRLVADTAFQAFLNRLLQGPELRAAFPVVPDQVAKVFADVAVFAAIDLPPNPLLLPIGHGDAFLHQQHTP